MRFETVDQLHERRVQTSVHCKRLGRLAGAKGTNHSFCADQSRFKSNKVKRSQVLPDPQLPNSVKKAFLQWQGGLQLLLSIHLLQVWRQVAPWLKELHGIRRVCCRPQGSILALSHLLHSDWEEKGMQSHDMSQVWTSLLLVVQEGTRRRLCHSLHWRFFQWWNQYNRQTFTRDEVE